MSKSVLVKLAECGRLEELQAFIRGMDEDNNNIPTTISALDGSKALVAATQKGYLDIVRYLIENKISGIHTTTACNCGVSPIAISSKKGDLQLVQYFVEQAGVNVNQAPARRGITPLAAASEFGHLKLVQYLVEMCGADVNAPAGSKSNGPTPLIRALRFNRLGICKYLVENGKADLTKRDKSGKNALHIAIRTKNFDLVRCLIHHGADVNLPENDGTSPLYLACSVHSLETVQLLLEKGAKIDEKDSSTLLREALGSNNLEMIVLLVKNGANINARSTQNGWTLIHYYCDTYSFRWDIEEQFEFFRCVYDLGADLNLQTYDNGMAPLHYIAHCSRFDTLKYLIETGKVDANVSTTGQVFGRFDPGSTPLHFACEFVNRNEIDLQIIEFLVTHGGADPTIQDEAGDTPLHVAAITGFTEAVVLLVNICGPHLLHIKSKDSLQHRYGLRIPETHDVEMCPLDMITDFDYSILQQLDPKVIHALQKQVLGNIIMSSDSELLQRKTSEETGNLPIHDACRYGSRRGVLSYMVKNYPAALHHRNAQGRLPLHEACISSSKGVVSVEAFSEILTHHRGAVVERDLSGKLPIELATENDAPLDIIYLLLCEVPELAQSAVSEQAPDNSKLFIFEK